MNLDKYSLEITPIATEGLRSIIDYIVNKLCNETAAETLLSEFNDTMERISAFPYAMAKVKNRKITSHGDYRKFLIRNFIGIYQIDEANKKIILMVFRYAPCSLGDLV